MKVIIPTIMTIIIFSASSSYSGGWVDGDTLKKYCSSKDRAERQYCVGFIAGAAGAATTQVYCEGSYNGKPAMIIGYYDGCENPYELNIPNSMMLGQARDIVIKYLRDHPERLHEQAHKLVDSALVDAFKFRKIKKQQK